jgi:S1-C subfamily serine protease
MKRALICIIVIFLAVSAKAQNVLTGQEIYRTNCKAIVQIKTENGFGVGFITSTDGNIITANHVVTKPASGFREYVGKIEVFVMDREKPYEGNPIGGPSTDQTNFDAAVIKIKATDLPHVTLGNLESVNVGDHITVIPSFPNIGCILLDGTIAAKGPYATQLGPKPVNTILFQSPIRNGFSGSPIFDSTGRVIGIEDTKVFGISPALSDLRQKWVTTQTTGGRAVFFGIDIAGSFIDVINDLDQNLISGMGSGVDISYAKKQQETK